MKSVFAIFLSLILVSTATRAHAQETMTVEQLLSAGNSENRAIAAAMYIAGWKDGTGTQLAVEAQSPGAIGSSVTPERAARLQALSDCLLLLGVADLVAELNAAMRDNSITPEMPATSALRVAMEGACPPGRFPSAARNQSELPWVPLIDSCMANGGQRTLCIEKLPPDVLAQLEAWETENAEMRRRQLEQRIRGL